MKARRWILVAEDNPHDAELTVRALREVGRGLDVVLVQDGEEVLDCLHRRSIFKDRPPEEPLFVLLDLKMPKINGFQVLDQIRCDARLRAVPVVIFSSSCEQADVTRSYEMGVNAYVVKPMAFQDYAAALNLIGRFWAELNEPPNLSNVMKMRERFTLPTAVPEEHLRSRPPT